MLSELSLSAVSKKKDEGSTFETIFTIENKQHTLLKTRVLSSLCLQCVSFNSCLLHPSLLHPIRIRRRYDLLDSHRRQHYR